MAEGLPKRLPKWLLFFAVLVSFGLAAPAQKAATITFTLDFPGSIPDHYSITVDSSGHASYISGGKRNADSDSDDFHYDFTISDWNRARIFDLASRARYFAGDINYAKRVASTGTKTLSYKDDERSTHTTYNYTTNQPVQHLTTIFQNISTTLEFAQRLQFEHKYQKLALDEELKRMEEAAQQSSLEEIQAVAPILKQILADSSVINVTRARAEHLLAKTGTGSH
ncbi:MAG: hypothetical protein DMG70_27360 [Acidobacteria bacterium]|nr:MAG: hypothetical protein DMG70_27360 [Acidobacteriota bacterium]PYY08975.1 MAG: hypothetical protein DMG69_12170 [Acidobacteriota bacterium]